MTPRKAALEPFERGAAGENPFAVQHELQDMMQDLVGIVRVEDEMQQALEEHRRSCRRARRKAGITGNREYNTGWHTALDLDNLLTISEIDRAGGDRAQGKPRRRISATTIPDKSDEWGEVQSAHQQGRRRAAAASSACR